MTWGVMLLLKDLDREKIDRRLLSLQIIRWSYGLAIGDLVIKLEQFNVLNYLGLGGSPWVVIG